MISTEYKGVTLRLSENDDTWSCFDLEIYQVEKLSQMKRRIDTVLRRKRKTENVPALHIGHRSNEAAPFGEVMITLIAKKPRPESSYEKSGSAWVVGDISGSIDKGRRKVDLDQLAPDSPEAREAIRLWIEQSKVAAAAKREADRLRALIPRVRYEDIPVSDDPEEH